MCVCRVRTGKEGRMKIYICNAGTFCFLNRQRESIYEMNVDLEITIQGRKRKWYNT